VVGIFGNVAGKKKISIENWRSLGKGRRQGGEELPYPFLIEWCAASLRRVNGGSETRNRSIQGGGFAKEMGRTREAA